MKLENILFLDIETVPLHPNYNDLSKEAQLLFADKTSYQRKEMSAADFYERAGIWAEFGKNHLHIGWIFHFLTVKTTAVSYDKLLRRRNRAPYKLFPTSQHPFLSSLSPAMCSQRQRI